jgi:hypothetical protein
VIGTARSAASTEHIKAVGAEALVLDLLDRQATIDAVRHARPDAVGND